jgi:hypothetical protein
LADPQHPSADLRRHLAACPDCTRYRDGLLLFEGRLARALRVPVASAQAAPPVRRFTARRGWLAMAASVLLAAVWGGSLWLAAPGASLAADVVSHMAEEPLAWSRTAAAVPEPALDRVMSESRLRFKSTGGLVTYANSCLFRGHRVPHLVVQTATGPVTVMVLTEESVKRRVRFDEQGYRGVIVPVPAHGSLAVLQRDPGSDMNTLDEVVARVRDAIEWTR